MPDVLIRDLDPATLSRLDAAAARTGVSRNVLLKRLLARWSNEQPEGGLTDEHVAAFGTSVVELLDPDFRATAWRR